MAIYYGYLYYLGAARLRANARHVQLRLAHATVVLEVDLKATLVSITIVGSPDQYSRGSHSRYSRGWRL